MGGGTFDVSIIEYTRAADNSVNFKVLAIKGHPFLGGEIFNHKFKNFLLKQAEEKAGLLIKSLNEKI